MQICKEVVWQMYVSMKEIIDRAYAGKYGVPAVGANNEMAIRAYKAKGFEVIDAVETDIGDGYIMDDYIMEKKLQ